MAMSDIKKMEEKMEAIEKEMEKMLNMQNELADQINDMQAEMANQRRVNIDNLRRHIILCKEQIYIGELLRDQRYASGDDKDTDLGGSHESVQRHQGRLAELKKDLAELQERMEEAMREEEEEERLTRPQLAILS